MVEIVALFNSLVLLLFVAYHIWVVDKISLHKKIRTFVILTDLFETGDSWYAPVDIDCTGRPSAPKEKEMLFLKKATSLPENDAVLRAASYRLVEESGHPGVVMLGGFYSRK